MASCPSFLYSGHDIILYKHHPIQISSHTIFLLIPQGEDDFASTLGMYDGYDSYNDSDLSTDNEDVDENALDGELFDNDEGISKYRFLNSKDGMGMLVSWS